MSIARCQSFSRAYRTIPRKRALCAVEAATSTFRFAVLWRTTGTPADVSGGFPRLIDAAGDPPSEGGLPFRPRLDWGCSAEPGRPPARTRQPVFDEASAARDERSAWLGCWVAAGGTQGGALMPTERH